MEPIHEGATGAAVEDIQERLASLGYDIEKGERDARAFGRATATAVARFRLDHGLSLGDAVDAPTWSVLVDECYQLGDRTLYLRLPNFHGNDVRQLQERLNVLGFSCGTVDGVYGVHTEAAVKLFQESIGALADGMAFQDTFDAIERLRHVWAGKPADGPHPQGAMGFARAANVLENAGIAITADDPISRNVAGRIWNLAHATVDDCASSWWTAPTTCAARRASSSSSPPRRCRTTSPPAWAISRSTTWTRCRCACAPRFRAPAPARAPSASSCPWARAPSRSATRRPLPSCSSTPSAPPSTASTCKNGTGSNELLERDRLAQREGARRPSPRII